MFKKMRERREAINMAMDVAGNKDIKEMCGLRPFNFYGKGEIDYLYVINIARGEYACPIFLYADSYDDAREQGKELIKGYRGYHVGVRKVKRY